MSWSQGSGAGMALSVPALPGERGGLGLPVAWQFSQPSRAGSAGAQGWRACCRLWQRAWSASFVPGSVRALSCGVRTDKAQSSEGMEAVHEG